MIAPVTFVTSYVELRASVSHVPLLASKTKLGKIHGKSMAILLCCNCGKAYDQKQHGGGER